MPHVISADETAGIPPLPQNEIQWLPEDYTTIASLAISLAEADANQGDLIITDERVEHYTERATAFLRAAALRCDDENVEAKKRLEAHVASHSRLHRPDVGIKLQ